MVHGLNAADITATDLRFAQFRADAARDRSASHAQITRIADGRATGSITFSALRRRIRTDRRVHNASGVMAPPSFSPPTALELADPR